MFLLFPVLLPRIGFWFSLTGCMIFAVLCFVGFALIVRQFGIDLL